jgi:LemA protein
MSIGLIVVITFGVIWGLWTLAAYVRLVRLRDGIARAFSVLVGQLKERHALADTLVHVHADMPLALKHATDAVLIAHRHASASCEVAAPRSLVAGPVRQMALAEESLGHALSHWQRHLSGTTWADQAEPFIVLQTRIDAAQQAYNTAALAYHDALQPLPTAVIANLFHFDPVSVMVLRTTRHAG